MLIPRFSIRLILILTTACAVFFLVMSVAARGNTIAMGVVVSVLTFGLAVAAYSITFLAAYAFARVMRIVKPSSRTDSPFATDNLPPQVIPPQNPE